MKSGKEIDVLGKACPIPIISLARAVRDLQAGETIRIVGNDPIFETSVVDFCRERGFEILDTTRDGRAVTILFRI